MTGWQLERPWALVLTAFVVVALVAWRARQAEAIPGGAHTTPLTWRAHLLDAAPLWGWWLALLAAGVAWANPRWGTSVVDERRSGVAIAHVVDVSESMLALDFGEGKERRTRLDGEKDVLEAFIKARPDDLHALTVFGDKVFTLVPLTSDGDLVRAMVRQLKAGMAGKATAIGDALALGVKRLRNAPIESRVIILLSDGKNNAGEIDPLEAAAFAQSEGIRVHTIAVGRGGDVPFQVDTFLGKRMQMVRVETDPDTLRTIAERTGGEFFVAESLPDLRRVYERINGMEKTGFAARRLVTWEDRYRPWLALALVLALAAWISDVALLRRFPAV
jgi:Ca-activated chloride channel family protein